MVVVVAFTFGASYLSQCLRVWTAWVNSYDAFLYPAIGAGAYAILWAMVFRKRIGMWENFQHEITHMIVALVCLYKVTGFKASTEDAAEEDNEVAIGWVETAGNARGFRGMLVKLAPYCLPTYAGVMLLMLTVTIPEVRSAVGVLFGAALASHLLSMLHTVRRRQGDLTAYGFPFSVLMIAYANVVFGTFFLEVFLNGWGAAWLYLTGGVLGAFGNDYWIPLYQLVGFAERMIGWIGR